jgi:hypothetical protein
MTTKHALFGDNVVDAANVQAAAVVVLSALFCASKVLAPSPLGLRGLVGAVGLDWPPS